MQITYFKATVLIAGSEWHFFFSEHVPILIETLLIKQDYMLVIGVL